MSIEGFNIIFMVAGPHSGFSLQHIFSVKRTEEFIHGRFFWGYAGTLCHPSKVNAFVLSCLEAGMGPPKVLLASTSSKYYSLIDRVREYSTSGDIYTALPEDVVLTGCKYAITARNITEVNCEVDLNKYAVATGGKVGKPLGEYIRYRVNKACASLANTDLCLPPHYRKLAYVADLVEPYCVFLR